MTARKDGKQTNGKTTSYWMSNDLLKKVNVQIQKDSVGLEGGVTKSMIIEHAYVTYLEDPRFREAVKKRAISKKVEGGRNKS